MKIGKIAIIGILLLSLFNSASAVWIYTDVDIVVGDITLNTLTDQNFSYVEIGTYYTNLSWDGTTFYNITFLTNISSSSASIQYDGAYETNLTVDVYTFNDTVTDTWVTMELITANDVTDVTSGLLENVSVNSTHTRYYYQYDPSDTLTVADLGLFDVNVTVSMKNATLIYTGFKVFEDVFTVTTGLPAKAEIDQPPINGTADDDLIELNGYCNLGDDVTNFSADIFADVYSPSGWSVNHVWMRFYTNNSWLDQNVTATSYTQVNSTHRRYSYEYNPSNTLSDVDMGLFDVNVSVSAENTTHQYSNYTLFTDVFEVYELQPIGNISSSYNSTYHAINMSWGQIVGNSEILYPDGDSTPQDLTLESDTYATHWEALNDTSTDHYVWMDSSDDELSDWFTMENLTESNVYSITNVTFYAKWRGDCKAICDDVYLKIQYKDETDTTIQSSQFERDSASYTWVTASWTPEESWTADNINNLTFGVQLDDHGSDDVTVATLYAIVEYNTINYTIGDGNADTFVVVRNNDSYPECPDDGYEVQNNTTPFYNTSVDFTEAYFSVFTYNATTMSYSSATHMPWGALGMNCFNESNTSQSIYFDVEITNTDASIVYTADDLSNPTYISLDDIPYGTNTVIVISNSSYKTRLYYKDLVLNHFYNFSFYLPPHFTPTDPGSGDSGGNTTETRLYLLTVVGPQNEYTSPPVEGAKISIARYINSTDSYEEIGAVLTSSNGEAEFFLVPFVLYKVTITKDGYDTKISDYIPSTDVFTKEFRIEPSSSTPTEYDIFWDDITFTGVMYINGTIKITYADSNSSTTDTQIYIYDVYNGSFTLNDTDSKTGNNGFSYWVTGINTSRDHEAWLYFNNTANYVSVESPVVILIIGVNKTWDGQITPTELEQRFTDMFGPFPLGYYNVIAIIIPVLLLCIFGPFNAGLGIISAGVSLGFIQAFFGVAASAAFNPFLALMCPVVIVLGFLYITSVKGSEHV